MQEDDSSIALAKGQLDLEKDVLVVNPPPSNRMLIFLLQNGYWSFLKFLASLLECVLHYLDDDPSLVPKMGFPQMSLFFSWEGPKS